MGVFRYRVEIAAVEAGPFVPVETLVDAGAAYTWIPSDVLAGLGVAPRDRRRFVVADRRLIERDVGIVVMRLDGKVQPTVCIFGDVGSEPLLGAVTLEEFALAPDPVHRRLVPVPVLYLLKTGTRR